MMVSEEPVRAVIVPREPRRKASAVMSTKPEARNCPKMFTEAPGAAANADEPPRSSTDVDGVRKFPSLKSPSERPKVLIDPMVRHAASVAVICCPDWAGIRAAASVE